MTSWLLPDPVLHFGLDRLDSLPSTLKSALESRLILRLGDLVRLAEPELLQVIRLSPQEMEAIKGALAEFGLCLGQDTLGYPPASEAKGED